VREFSCGKPALERSSHRNEHQLAFNELQACMCRGICLRGISVGARAECFPAIAPAPAYGREPRRARLCRHDDCVGQLQLFCPCPVGDRTSSGYSIFESSGVDSAVGRIAFSWRMHFRACAACARLNCRASRRGGRRPNKDRRFAETLYKSSRRLLHGVTQIVNATTKFKL
jgi:hypothetical protein